MLIYTFTILVSVFFAFQAKRVSDNLTKNLNLLKEESELQMNLKINQRQKKIILKKKKKNVVLPLHHNVLKNVWNMEAKIFLFISFLPLFIVSAIRYLVGTDYAGTYQLLYSYTLRDGYKFKFAAENLYYLLNRIAILYSGNDYVGVFILSSLLVCMFMFIGFKNSSINIGYSVLLWLVSGGYFWSFNVVRQSIAMAFFVFGFQYIQKRKAIPYFLCVLFAVGFHKTALLYFPIYFIPKIKIKLIAIISGLLLTIVFNSAFKNIAILMSSHISAFNIFLSRYLASTDFEPTSFSQIMINLLFLILFIVIWRIYGEKDQEADIYLIMQFIATVFVMLTSVIPWASRMARLFNVVLPISIPYMIALIPRKNDRNIVNFSIVICFCIYTIVTFFILGYHDVVPYKTIFSR